MRKAAWYWKEAEKYWVYDEDGSIVGLSEAAPESIKSAWETDQKREEELFEKYSIDL